MIQMVITSIRRNNEMWLKNTSKVLDNVIKDCLPKEAVGVPYGTLLKISGSEMRMTKAKMSSLFPSLISRMDIQSSFRL